VDAASREEPGMDSGERRGKAPGAAADDEPGAFGIRSGRSGTSGAAGSGRRSHRSAARRVAEPGACSGSAGSPTCRVQAANAPAARGGSVAPPPADG